MTADTDTPLAPAVAAVGLSLSVIAVVAGLTVFSPAADTTAVLFADDHGVAAVAAAGGAIVDVRLWGHLVLAKPQGATFHEDVVRQGALAALPVALLAGCSAPSPINRKDERFR